MSFRKENFLSFKETISIPKDYLEDQKSGEDLRNLFLEILNSKIHGFCFSLYEDGQKPGDLISEEQIRRRMNILSKHTSWIRSFSCIEGHEIIPKTAKEFGLKTLVGAWLGKDEEKNQMEIESLVQLAKDGFVDIAVVGNEVLYRKDLTLEDLLSRIQNVKNQITNIPVGYVDAYYEFDQRPELADICDVILCNCYPYWEGTENKFALKHKQYMYNLAKTAAKGKRVIITEAGWPSKGESLGNAIPSQENALKYFINTQLWAIDENIELFYFSSFDESWKVDDEGEVGAYWGIWDKNEKLKYLEINV